MATGPDGTIYRVDVPAGDMRRLAKTMTARGMNGASPPSNAERNGAALDTFVTKDLSDNVDDRVKLPAGFASWQERLGVLSWDAEPWCTGSQFDSRLVLSSMHCFFDDAGNWVDLSYRAGQDGTSTPFGEVDHVWKFWPQAFLDKGCNEIYLQECLKWDWVIVVLAQPTGASNFGFARSSTSSDSTVANWDKFQFGYPGCGETASPENCTPNALYGQFTPCETGDFFGNVGGWNRNMWHGCDTSRGHSGGALFSWSPGDSGPYIVGMATWGNSCTPFDRCGATPNVAFRIDRTVYDCMSYLKSIY